MISLLKVDTGKILLLAGVLAGGTAQADNIPNLWGPKVVAPASLHVTERTKDQGGEARRLAEGFNYVSLHPVLFNSGKATISPEGHKALDAAADYLLKHNNVRRVLIEGNTDYIGKEGYNDRLSDRRNEMVRNYLALKGVDPNLIVMNGQGESDPVDQNWTRSGRQRNRHVAIHAIYW